MSFPLQDLPAEVQDLVISLCNDQSSLAALARTSKALHRMTLPHLYQSISLSHSYDIQATEHLWSLTITLLRRPEIAALVHSFTIRPIYNTESNIEHSDDEPRWTTWLQQPDVDQLLREAIEAQLAPEPEVAGPPTTRASARKTGKDQVEEWLRLARAGNNEASILALLLPNLVNLQSLDVPLSEEWQGSGVEQGDSQHTYYVAEMLERAGLGKKLNGQPILGKLTDVMVADIDDKYPDNPMFVALCVSLPAVKRLYGCNQGNMEDGDDGEGPEFPFNRLQPSTSNTELLHLRHSKIKSSNFLKLMQAFKCLKTLIYEIGNTWAWTSVQFAELQRALNAHRKSLEQLCLSHAPFYPYQDDTDELTPMTFQGFSALKHFQVSPVYLYGGERLQYVIGGAERDKDAPAVTKDDLESTRMLLLKVLPQQLQTLDLLYCSDASTLHRVWLGLEEILVHKDEQFPHLQEVSIQGEDDTNLKEALSNLTSLPWKTKGVRFVVRLQGLKSTSDGYGKPNSWGWNGGVEWAECLHDEHGLTEILYDSVNHD